MKHLTTVIILCILLASSAQAQPNLNFKRITVNWPTIEVYFAVSCDGVPAHDMVKQNFAILENGKEIENFTYWCPDPSIRCAVSVALVADVSGSMRGEALDDAKLLMKSFVDLLDGQIDEATLISAGNDIRVEQIMTPLKLLLLPAVQQLESGGQSNTFDGVIRGIEELINSGVNQCRAILVFTDGLDNASEHGIDEIISLANRNRLRVFTISTGYTIQDVDLERLALFTGGRYYRRPNAGQMAAIYQEISSIIFQGFYECVLTYERGCADGSMRTVSVQLKDFCNGADEKSQTYRAPLDSTTFREQHFRLGTVVSEPTDIVSVPFLLDESLGSRTLFPFDITITNGRPARDILDVTIPPDSPLNGLSMSLDEYTDSIRIQLFDTLSVQSNDTLFALRYGTLGVFDSTFFPLSANVQTNYPCILTDVLDGGYYIVPKLFPIIEPEGPVSACPGDVVILRANEGFSEYRWSNGAKTESVSIDEGGVYFVDVVSFLGDTLRSKSVLVDMPRKRVVRIDTGSGLQICNGEQLELTVAGDTAGCRYFWNGSSTPSETMVASTEGEYWAVAVDFSGCTHPTDTVRVSVAAPSVTLNVGDVAWLCEEDTLRLTVTEQYPRYAWSTGDSTRSITITPDDWQLVTVTAWDSAGCMSFPRTVECRLFGSQLPAIFTPDGRALCNGIGIRLEAAVGITDVAWSTGERTRSIVVSAAGDYSLAAIDSNGCEVRDSVRIFDASTLPLPEIYAPTGLTLCDSWPIRLYTEDSYYGWKWSTGDTTRAVAISDTGWYYVDVMLASGCMLRSNPVHVDREFNPPPIIEIDGGTAMCPGDTIRLTAPAGQVLYFWNTKDTTRNILVTQPGIYAVTYLSPGGCENSTDAVRIRYHGEERPRLARSGDSLFTTSDAMSIQWVWDGVRIPGETDSVHHVTRTGRYWVEVVDSCGRTQRSDTLLVSTLDMRSPIANTPQLSVYPDPARNMQNLHISGCQGSMTVTLHDLLGRQRLSRHVPHNGTLTLDVSALPRGVYILRLTHAQGSLQRRVVLE
ncbi:T9SS type A sorting domain-containing protein [bacterium]|nr:T9SS type A sorting domain-containing protein [bacterium]